MKLRLRAFEEKTFRKSEFSNFMEWAEKNEELAAMLGERDALVLISKSHDQLWFIFGIKKTGDGYEILGSRKLRLMNGTFSPLMLQNYGELVGIEFEGIKRFEEYYSYLLEQKTKRKK